MKGIITKGIGGFYYVMTEKGLIESHARGVFREDKKTPVIGDIVNLRISDEDNKGYIINIEDRKTELLRPSVANVEKSIIVMSIEDPEINLWLLDKFLLMSEYEGLDICIVINKVDLNIEKSRTIKENYEKIGYECIMTSTIDNTGIEELKSAMKGKINVLSGPSGAGKSSLLNKVNPDFKLETGDISDKTKRGKHTTRHVELFQLEKDTYVLDTPGFSSLNLSFIEDELDIRYYFKEIDSYGQDCKFTSCMHISEPKCRVKESVEEGNIIDSRYENYLKLVEEVKKSRRY